MEKVYMVMQHYQDYGDSSSIPIYASTNPAKAATKVVEMEQRRKDRDAVEAKMEAYMAAWELANPTPVCRIQYHQQALPQYSTSPRKWTKEQKDEVNAVKEKNRLAESEAMRPYADWIADRYKVLLAYEAALPAREQEDLRGISKDNEWDVVEMTVEE